MSDFKEKSFDSTSACFLLELKLMIKVNLQIYYSAVLRIGNKILKLIIFILKFTKCLTRT